MAWRMQPAWGLEGEFTPAAFACRHVRAGSRLSRRWAGAAVSDSNEGHKGLSRSFDGCNNTALMKLRKALRSHLQHAAQGRHPVKSGMLSCMLNYQQRWQ